MKKISLIDVVLLLFIFLFFSCSKGNEEIESSVKRTVVVYMMAHNSLSSMSEDDIDEMIAGMNDVDISRNNLLIYIDTGDSSPKLMKLDRENGKIVETVIKTYDEQISTDETVMKSVLSTAYSSYPADSYGLVLWSHGWGWVPKTSSMKVISRYAGIDDSEGGPYYLNISTLASVLSTVPHLDYILFDECFMSSVEALYDLRSNADYFIGSPTEIPGPGAYYTDVVPAMFYSSATVTNNAERVADAYYTYYQEKYDLSKTLSDEDWTAGVSVALVKGDELDTLAIATKQIIPEYVQNGATINSSGIFCYDPERGSYFYDLDALIKQLTNGNSEYTAWKSVFDRCVVKYETTATNYMSDEYGNYKNATMTGASGLSAYIPNSSAVSTDQYFQNTGWYKAAGWNLTGW